MALNLRMPSAASNLFHQLLLVSFSDAGVAKIVRWLRMSTQIVR
jgi:hypothetical protein